MLTMLAAIAFLQAANMDEPARGLEPGACVLTTEDKVANRSLTFFDFDQRGVTPATARALGERGCDAQAAEATEDFLLFGPDVTDYQRNVLSWHLAQYLATAGDEAAAARVVATTRRAPVDEPDGFDWNTYINGTWAFLTKDRTLLDEAATRLSAAEGVRNGMNAKVLRRLQKCFERSYSDAYTVPDCAVD